MYINKKILHQLLIIILKSRKKKIILIFILVIYQVISPRPPPPPSADELIGLNVCDSLSKYPNKKSTFDTDQYQKVENLFNIIASHTYSGWYRERQNGQNINIGDVKFETIIEQHPNFYIRMRTTYQIGSGNPISHIEQTSQASIYGFHVIATMKNVALVQSYTTRQGINGPSELLVYSVNSNFHSAQLTVQPFISGASSKIDSNSLKFQQITHVDSTNNFIYLLFDRDDVSATDYADLAGGTDNYPGQVHKFSFSAGGASVFAILKYTDTPGDLTGIPSSQINSNGIVGGNHELLYDAFWKKFFKIVWGISNTVSISALADISWTPTNPLFVQKMAQKSFVIIQKCQSTYNFQFIFNPTTDYYVLEATNSIGNSYVTDNLWNFIIKNSGSSKWYYYYGRIQPYTITNSNTVDDINNADFITFHYQYAFLISLDQDRSSTLVYQLDTTGTVGAVLQKQLDISDQLNYRLFNKVSTHLDISTHCACSDIRVVSYNCFGSFKCTMTTSYETVDCTLIPD